MNDIKRFRNPFGGFIRLQIQQGYGGALKKFYLWWFHCVIGNYVLNLENATV
jgi:hypothetical protein